MSLVNQQNLLSKIYLPRLFMPTATVGGAVVDMFLSALVFCGMLTIYHFSAAQYSPSWATLIYLPPLLILSLVLALGSAFLLSALTINFRDMRFLIPFMSQMLMWINQEIP